MKQLERAAEAEGTADTAKPLPEISVKLGHVPSGGPFAADTNDE